MPGRIVNAAALVAYVLAVCSKTQINDAVVSGAPINMVNVRHRPLAIDIKPRQPMCSIAFVLYTNVMVPMPMDTPRGLFASKPCVPAFVGSL